MPTTLFNSLYLYLGVHVRQLLVLAIPWNQDLPLPMQLPSAKPLNTSIPPILLSVRRSAPYAPTYSLDPWIEALLPPPMEYWDAIYTCLFPSLRMSIYCLRTWNYS